MIAFGAHVRRVRQFLGLSQEVLARRAFVSQGMVSRFELGRGLNTPFLGILKINLALASELRRVDPKTLSDDVRRFLAFMEFLVPRGSAAPRPGGVAFARLAVGADRDLERLVRRYRQVPAGRRAAFVNVVEAAVGAFVG